MFKLAWKPVISALAYAFTSGTQDEGVIQRAITGFRQCATLAARFGLAEVFDDIVMSLSSATGLLDETEDGYQVANHPVVETDNQSVTVSPLSIRIGSSYRSQLATVVLFTIANGNGNAIREGWLQVRYTACGRLLLTLPDFRNVPNAVPPLVVANAHAADGRFPRWNNDDRDEACDPDADRCSSRRVGSAFNTVILSPQPIWCQYRWPRDRRHGPRRREHFDRGRLHLVLSLGRAIC